MRREDGFTLVELMAAITLSAVLLALSAGALRTFWLNQGLDGAAGEIRSQLRQLQQRAESESHPIVYGGWFIQGSSTWGVVRYNAGSNSCASAGIRTFDAGVTVSAIQNFDVPSAYITTCRSALQTAGVANASTARMSFFYARGTATAGSVTLRQPALDRTRTVGVTALTGRVS
ncbi:MAG: Tfp pilus assembly protein FimT/FimU [Actinomycetota bacterium]